MYGPPTRMPGIVNRPSSRVVATYCVPEGTCTAWTCAPAIAVLVAESVTTPVIVAVVRPWASSDPDTATVATATASIEITRERSLR